MEGGFRDLEGVRGFWFCVWSRRMGFEGVGKKQRGVYDIFFSS